MKIVFMGTPDIALESLEKIYNSDIEVSGVVTVPDRPSGRSNKIVYSPVKEFALKNNIRLFQPEKISSNKEFKDEIRAIDPDLVVVVSYGMILPKSFLDIPKYGCINLHPSLLPKYRGAAPIQWAVLNGDKKTGVTIMYLDEGMDSGDIISQEEVEIGDDETTGELWKRLSTIGSEMLFKVIKNIEYGKIERRKQEGEYTLAPMINKEMSKINWNDKTASEIKNLVRGLDPFMGTYTFLGDKKIKIWKVQKLTEQEWQDFSRIINTRVMDLSVPSGTILLADSKLGLYVKTLDGVISILEIQGENARRMGVLDFLRGTKINNGEQFD